MAASTVLETSGTSGTTHGNGAPQENGKRRKLHGRAFYESIGSPKLVLAPMVEQSEFVCLIISLMSPYLEATG
jgi:tRNA-dihydrouridine synthase 1